ncbi:MAG: hypothetical protein HFJ12_04190 [Bacilli bacterium]|nr:hypothetical protein [Bacilli bacterium]
MSTYIPYDKLKSAGSKLKSIKNQLDNLKIEENGKSFKKLQIANAIPTYEDAKIACKTKSGDLRYLVTPDIKWYIDDANYNFVCKETETQEEHFINKPNSLKARTKADGDKKIIYKIPSISRIGKAMGYPEYPLQYNKDNIEKIRHFIERGINEYNNLVDFAQAYNKKIENLKDALEIECGNISNIYTAYKDLEKSARNQFEGKKTGKKYSNTEIAKKYAALVTAAGAKNANKYLGEILKGTKSKVSKSTVLSIYKKWKGNKNKTNAKETTKDRDDRTIATSATAATIVNTKSKKSSNKNKSSKNKSEKKKSAKNVLAGATVLAATRKGIKDDIKRVKADAKIQITNAKITAADEKRKLEIEKNERIAEINRKAAEEIEAVDINDENAQEKIDEIKARAESEIDTINNQYNSDIAKIDEDLNKQTAVIESNRDKDVENLNKQLDKLKSTKKANGVLEQRVVGTTLKGSTVAAVATTSNSDVSVSNEDMMNATGGLANAYEEKSAAIQSIIDTSGDTLPTDPSVIDTTVNNNPNASVTIEESVASPVPPSTEAVTEKSVTAPYETPSSNDSYVTNDGPREDLTPDSSTNQSEPTKDTGFDQSNTPNNIENDIENNNSNLNEKEEIVSITGGDKESSSKKGGNGLSTAIPIGLGVAATGAAAVAGVRYVKNRKQNEDMDEFYDDENNNLEDESEYADIPSDSAYMRDDYLGPEGSSYTELPDENSYTDAEELEEAAGIGGFSEDAALSDLN